MKNSGMVAQPASVCYLDNLQVSYPYPYTRIDCDKGQNASYRYGFNGKEKLSELYGEGNAIDFGDRIHDARLGRFSSLDPLSIKYPSHSNYSYCANNPIYFIEIKGRYFTGAIKELSSHIERLKTSTSKEAKEQLNNIQRMQNSDVEFHIDMDKKGWKSGSGETSFDFNKNRVVIQIKDGQRSTLAHELEHGRQFIDGEIDYVQKENGESSGGRYYDKSDEFKAIKAEQFYLPDGETRNDAQIQTQIEDCYDPQIPKDSRTIDSKEEGILESNNYENLGIKYVNKYNYIPTEKQVNEKNEQKNAINF